MGTTDLEVAADILQLSGVVLLEGSTYSGKTTLGHALLRRADNRGRTCMRIVSPGHWGDKVHPDLKPTVLLDEVFGRHAMSREEVVAWSYNLDLLAEWCKTRQVEVVVTVRPHVLEAIRCYLPNSYVFNVMNQVSLGDGAKNSQGLPAYVQLVSGGNSFQGLHFISRSQFLPHSHHLHLHHLSSFLLSVLHSQKPLCLITSFCPPVTHSKQGLCLLTSFHPQAVHSQQRLGLSGSLPSICKVPIPRKAFAS